MFALLRRYLRRVDALYLALCAACSAVSVMVLVSIGQTQLGSNNKASVQLIASLLGVMLAFIFSTVDYRALARAWPLHATVAWGLVLPTLFLHNFRAGVVTIGYDAGGTSNYSWYRVGGMTFQPAELAKISFILTLALHLSRVRGRVNQPKNLLLLLLHIGVPTALIHIQGDDGTALVFLGIGVFMLYAGGLSNWVAGGALAAGVVGGGALLKLRPGILKGYQFKRILAVITPDDPNLADITYQQNKGAMAIGTGGLTGTGLFTPEHIFVPNAWNDFIFAYLANVLGFVGAAAVLALLPEVHIGMGHDADGVQRMLLNGEDVTADIRLPEISMYASAVSAIQGVRDFLMEMQRSLAREHSVIMDGRDIGTVVLPDADVKIFLYADVKVRAGRRALELEQRGTPKPYEEVLREMEERDYNDTHRAAAPLRAADDAIMIDTSDMDFDASRELLLDVIRGSVSS